MPSFSYNEAAAQRLQLRHIFIPSMYGAVSEAIIGLLALIVFNIGTLNHQLVANDFHNVDALPLWQQVIRQMLDSLHSHPKIEQAMLFSLWAVTGAILYIVLFRALQTMFGVKRSVGLGVRFVRQDHKRGLFRWLASLHDFFLAAVIIAAGVFVLVVGVLFCFSYASEELKYGLTVAFPGNIKPLLLSGLFAIISVRLVALSLSLLSRRFRNWYTA